jgi:sterol 3beta-glucosyltransferase
MPMLRKVLDDSWQVAQGSDVIVYHPKTLGGSHIAERLQIPAFLAHPVPMMSATKAFPSPFWPNALECGGHFNRASYGIMNLLMTLPYRGVVNAWRKEVLGLKPRALLAGESVPGQKPVVRLYGCSPQVVSVPSDWDNTTVMTGYWFLDREPDWVPPADLQAFLESGPPPVYIGFGSMGKVMSNDSVQVAVEALQRLGQRGVMALGVGDSISAKLPSNIYLIDNVPHDWLFPRMKAVVHHGGAGTTAAGLRAGKPTVVLPFFGDQPFWGNRVYNLGVGPKPISQKKLTVERLSEAIDAVRSDHVMLRNAQTLGEKIRSEDGVTRAIEVIANRV